MGEVDTMGEPQKKWVKEKFTLSEPLLFAYIESLLPEGPIADGQEWTVDPKKVSSVVFAGVDVTKGEIKGRLTGIHEDGGAHRGTLKVEGKITLAKDPETGTPWREAARDSGQAWLSLEGDIPLEGSLSLDGAPMLNQLSAGYSYKGTTEPQEVGVKTDKGVVKEKHNVVTRISRSWWINFERAPKD
jgi:hypothetical protein